MTNKILKYPLDKFKEQFDELKNSSVELYFDVENEKAYKKVKSIIAKDTKKFKRIVHLMLSGKYSDNLYKIEDKPVIAMKFLGKKNNNARIYCKEYYKNGKKIVMVTGYHKKVEQNQNDHKIRNIIEKIKSNNYEFKEN